MQSVPIVILLWLFFGIFFVEDGFVTELIARLCNKIFCITVYMKHDVTSLSILLISQVR